MNFDFEVFTPFTFTVFVPNKSFDKIASSDVYSDCFKFSDDIYLDFVCVCSSELSVSVDVFISHSSAQSCPSTKYFMRNFNLSFSSPDDVSDKNLVNNVLYNVWDKISYDLYDYSLSLIQTELDFESYRSDVYDADYLSE